MVTGTVWVKENFNSKARLILVVFLSFSGIWLPAQGGIQSQIISDEIPVMAVEMRYEKLMKIYLNKIKLAFSETDDARLITVLQQFQPEFNLKTENIKQELEALLKNMSPAQKAQVYARLSKNSHIEELITLLFDERIISRQEANPEIKLVMEQLYAKCLEIPKSGREFVAAEK